MISRGTKVRLAAFVILSAVGIVYVAGTYLGIVDRVLGRGLHVSATLPTSGGLYNGSDVTYRGVSIGKVSSMDVIASGVRVDLTLKQGTRLPEDSAIYVHNLSAVGEQYLDFEPDTRSGPYAGDGYTYHGDAMSMPVAEEDLLVDLNRFVDSVNRKDLTTSVRELGTMFRGTGVPLQHMVDSGSQFVAEARAHQDSTLKLFDAGQTVLTTQQAHADDIRAFARNLADLTGTLKASDGNIRTLIEGGRPALREVDSLLKGLEPTLPVFLGNLVTVNQVLTTNLPGLEQTLVTFPRVIASGFTGTPGDGYGHINLQLDNTVPPCTKGYLPPSRWRPATDTSDTPVFPARCLSGAPINMRGSKYAPSYGSAASGGRSYRVSPYDASTGAADVGNGDTVTMGTQGGLDTVFGSNAWQWMLIGPVARGE